MTDFFPAPFAGQTPPPLKATEESFARLSFSFVDLVHQTHGGSRAAASPGPEMNENRQTIERCRAFPVTRWHGPALGAARLVPPRDMPSTTASSPKFRSGRETTGPKHAASVTKKHKTCPKSTSDGPQNRSSPDPNGPLSAHAAASVAGLAAASCFFFSPAPLIDHHNNTPRKMEHKQPTRASTRRDRGNFDVYPPIDLLVAAARHASNHHQRPCPLSSLRQVPRQMIMPPRLITRRCPF
jgi:hypothetical protein